MDVLSEALAWMVGAGRLLTGLVFLALPAKAAESWVDGTSTAARYLTRAVGGRDAAIGGGIIWALLADETVIPWIIVSIAGDVADGASSDMLPDQERRKTLAFAGGFGLLGIIAAVTLLAA